MTFKQNVPESKYLLEARRLGMQHEILKSYMGKLIMAPLSLEQPRLKILDSGTFDGFWLLDAAKQLTSPILVGTDIYPEIFPVPTPGKPYMKFFVQSIKDPWPVDHQGAFDLVHQRLVLACTTPDGGSWAVRNLMGLAKPGRGWVQLVEATFEHLTAEQKRKHPATARFQQLVAKVLPLQDWNPHVGLQVAGWMRNIGLVDVEERVFEVPVGVAAADKQLGEMAKQNMLGVVQHFRDAAKSLPVGCEVSAEDFESVFHDISVEIDTVGSVMRYDVVWGRRP